MVIELLSYNTSIVNPLLKLMIIIGFSVAALFFYQSRKKYGGILHTISTLLCIGAVTGSIAALFRFQGDFYTEFKWGESLLDLILVLITLIIAILIRRKIYETASLFELSEEEL